jgi:tetratricopeptide (TPR) repeat protein
MPMQQSRLQLIFIVVAIAAFITMYFGCETKPKNIKALEKSRALSMEVTGVQNIINEARKKLTPNQLSAVETMSAQLDKDTTTQIATLQMLASEWYKYGHAAVSGHYAEQIAEKSNTEEAWSITGTTYVFGIKTATDDKVKEFCKARAIKAFEKALSLNPNNVDHQINMALCYVERPSQDNPMKGILILRELNTKYPENVSVINQLASLALKTNQIDKAMTRLNQALKLDSKNKTTICLLAEAYELAKDVKNAEVFKKKCLNQ